MMSRGVTDQTQIYQQFIHDLHFAQPIPEHNVMADGYHYLFNPEGLQHFVDNAFRLDASGQLDYTYLGEQLHNADTYLSTNYPAMGFDYTLHNQIPYYAGLNQDATTYALNEIGMPAMAAQQAAISAAHGVATAAGIESKKVSGPFTDKSGGTGGPGAAPGRPAPTPPARPDTPTPTEEDEEERRPETEPTVPTELIVNWSQRISENYQSFAETANAVLYNSTKKNWADMEANEQDNIASLLRAIKANNDAATPHRFKIFISIGAQDFMPSDPPAAANGIFGMQIEDPAGNLVAADDLDLTTMRPATSRPMIRMQENPLPAGQAPRTDRITAYDLQRDLHQYTPYSDNNRYKVELVRRTEMRDGRRERLKVGEDDIVDRDLEILRFTNDNNGFVLRDSRGSIRTIRPADLANVDEIKISTWY